MRMLIWACWPCPVQVESKVESAGLALWADIAQPPGSLPPDCVHFLQQALTKDPRARPSAQQLLGHAWLARCEAGEPWRNPAELEVARRAAELATWSGWLRINGRRTLGRAGALLERLRWRGGGSSCRVAPAWGTAADGSGGSSVVGLPAVAASRDLL